MGAARQGRSTYVMLVVEKENRLFRNVNYQNVLINSNDIRSLVIAIAGNKRNLSENGPQQAKYGRKTWKRTFAYRPFWRDSCGLRTMMWPSTPGCHPNRALVNEKALGDLLTAVISLSNGTTRKQAIKSVELMHPVSATSWSNKDCWLGAVMSRRL